MNGLDLEADWADLGHEPRQQGLGPLLIVNGRVEGYVVGEGYLVEGEVERAILDVARSIVDQQFNDALEVQL